MHENLDEAEARRQARRLVENITNNHTLNGTVFGTPLESLLNNCLEILSKQLYEKNTHFLLELIQNADDNSYNCATPTLSFIYKSGILRIDCNEVGFDASNVTAICGISQSTKSNKTRDGEFIGEKGIGFKSVFKVADTVRIASNEFTFKFDLTKPLGMITSLWEERPERSKKQGTSITLQLSTSYNEQTLIEELFDFDTNLLVFLRRIQEINIEVKCADSAPWKKQIRKIQYEQDCDRIVRLETGEKLVNFVTRTHVVKSLPREARRNNWTENKVLFAFPLPSATEEPTLETRNVYAFLPIRSYGFKFLIQADFILTVSREDIESTLPWNVSIRDALSDAFLSSILHFDKSDMKYVWPFYLPSISNAISGFFEPAIASILNRVEESPVFESFVGNMVLPTSLAHVPADFCADGEPFTLCKTTQDRYLSSHYAIWVMEAMKSVGVQQLTARQFLEDLATMLATDAGSFQQKSSQWHTKLAATLLRLSTDADLMSLVQNLAIIPLNDGTWVAARDSNIFFSKSEDSLEIPGGISISILDSDVEADLNRRMLFISLGVKEWSAAEICRLIMDLHQSADFQPHRLSTAEIVSHATFVYQAEWQPPKSADLWFATTRSERARGRDTYFPGISSADSAAARVFAVLEQHFPVIHPDYLIALPEAPDFPHWLVQNLRLSKVPRLITPVVEPQPQPMEINLSTVIDSMSHNHVDPSSNDTVCKLDPTSAETVQNSTIPAIDASQKSNLDLGIDKIGLDRSKDPRSPEAPISPIRKEQNPDQSTFQSAPQAGKSNIEVEPEQPTLSTGDLKVTKAYRPVVNLSEKALALQEAEFLARDRVLTQRVRDRTKLEKRSTGRFRFPWANLTGITPERLNQLRKDSPVSNGASIKSIRPLVRGIIQLRKLLRRTAGVTRSMDQDVSTAISGQDNPTAKPPSIQDESEDLLFKLSEEFKCMLCDCESTDVLQLIKDNWHHYSQWVEGSHLNWQSKEFKFASAEIRTAISGSLMRSSRGHLPLHETVLATLDMQLDSANALPALDLLRPQDPKWNFLTYFGVSVKNDVLFYLRCIGTLSGDESLDADVVVYIYEQIQSRYTGNEALIRATFYSKEIVLINPDDDLSVNAPSWANMETCIAQGIDLTSVYGGCSFLFRSLYSPSGDPIGGLVHAITMITSSSKLENIARLFRELSTSLHDVNSSKLALLLKPLQNKLIFPIVDEAKKFGYDRLSGVHDKSWYIADDADSIASFAGLVPLLAFSAQDLSVVGHLLRALRVDGRMISKQSTYHTRVIGQTKPKFHFADSLSRKLPYLKALVPRNHSNEAALRRQISQLRVRIATSIVRTFRLSVGSGDIIGKPIPGNVCMISTDSSMTLVMTDEAAKAAYPIQEYVSTIAHMCGIKEQRHIMLLFAVLSSSQYKNINTEFLQHGLEVEGPLLEDDPEDDFDYEEDLFYSASGIDEASTPLLNEETNFNPPTNLTLSEGFRFEAQGHEKDEVDLDSDRRIPMVPRIKGAGNTYLKVRLSELERKEDEFVENDHVQFLGENMVVRLLAIHLGSSFDPGRDWTSDLRERAVLTYVPEDSSVAPFTLTQSETIERMTALAVQYGVSCSDDWQERLRRSSPIYHVDVLISGVWTGRFVMEVKWIERTMKLKLPTSHSEEIAHVNVLFHLTQAFSEANFSIDMIVDPCHLIYSGKLKFTRNWLMQGVLDVENLDPGVEQPAKEDWAQEAVDVPNEDQQLILYKKPDQDLRPSTYTVTNNPKTKARVRRNIIPFPDILSIFKGSLYLPWSRNEATGIFQSHNQPLHTTGGGKHYSYKPLLHGYIRLLYLLPSNSDGSLQGVLNHIASNYAGTYQALSYVWGGEVRDRELSTPDGTILITTSLYKALTALRQKDQRIMIWADAVCINQADNKEKAQQIRIMPEIYQACKCTYAFLSEGNPTTDEALGLLTEIRARATRENQPQSKANNARQTRLPHMTTTSGVARLPPPNSPIWASVAQLFTLPYFRRAWIIQEVVAAPNVKLICGEWLVEWKDLCTGQEILEREVQMAELDDELDDVVAAWEPFKDLAEQREWEMRQHRWVLLNLLERFRHAESTLDRDRFFCLVGLASDGNEVDFDPDYESSFQDIVLRFAQAFVRQGRGIQLLYRAGIICAEDENERPSWIPDWTSKRPSSLQDSSEIDSSFLACGPEPQHLILGPGPTELSADGYEIDTIITISAASNRKTEWPDYFAEIDSMIDKGVLSDAMGARESLKWKAPIAGAPFPTLASYTAFRKHIANSTIVSSNDPDDDEVNVHKMYAECLQKTLARWKFLITKRGFAGVVPPLSQVGDSIAVMKGGCVPFVLRGSSERWRLVGECYVHGIMRGEGLWLPGVTEKTFLLH